MRLPASSAFGSLLARGEALPVDRLILSRYCPLCMTAGEGEPIVLVHGLAGGIDLVMPLMPLLAEKRRVCAYQLRGEERHSPAHQSFAELADDLLEVMDALHLDRAAVLGLSFGAGVALEAALTRPDRVRAVILQGAAARLRFTFVHQVALEILSTLDLPTTSALVNRAFGVLFQRHGADREVLQFVIERCWRTPQATMVQRLEAVERFNVHPRLGRLAVPALVIAGDEDIIVDPRRSARLARSVPDGTFRALRRAGHLGFLTQPAEFAALVDAFLSQPAAG